MHLCPVLGGDRAAAAVSHAYIRIAENSDGIGDHRGQGTVFIIIVGECLITDVLLGDIPAAQWMTVYKNRIVFRYREGERLQICRKIIVLFGGNPCTKVKLLLTLRLKIYRAEDVSACPHLIGLPVARALGGGLDEGCFSQNGIGGGVDFCITLHLVIHCPETGNGFSAEPGGAKLSFVGLNRIDRACRLIGCQPVVEENQPCSR